MRINSRLCACLCLTALGMSGCVGAAIETATDAAIAVGKVPFKVGGAVVDVATPDKKEKRNDDDSTER